MTQLKQRDVCFTADLRSARLSYLWDHAAGGRSLLPGTALLEMAAAAGRCLHGACKLGTDVHLISFCTTFHRSKLSSRQPQGGN